MTPSVARSDEGFTLLEVLVVITLIGILTGVAVLSFGAIGQRQLSAEVGRLQLAFNQAEDITLMEQLIIGWFYNSDTGQYEFLQWNHTDEQAEWQAMPQKIFLSHTLNPGIRLYLDEAAQQDNTHRENAFQKKTESEPPALVFLNNGEYTPFQLSLVDKSGSKITLSGDGFNSIAVLETRQ